MDMTLSDFVSREAGPNWCVTLRRSRGIARYDTIITPSRFDRLQEAYVKAGGNPDQVNPRVLERLGWRQVWVPPSS
jgi:hypothetical protein